MAIIYQSGAMYINKVAKSNIKVYTEFFIKLFLRPWALQMTFAVSFSCVFNRRINLTRSRDVLEGLAASPCWAQGTSTGAATGGERVRVSSKEKPASNCEIVNYTRMLTIERTQPILLGFPRHNFVFLRGLYDHISRSGRCSGVVFGVCQLFDTIILHTVSKNFETNCGPLSLSTFFRISYGMTQMSTKSCTTFPLDELLSANALVNLENRSYTTMKCWFPDLVLGKGPEKSMEIDSGRPSARNRRTAFWWRYLVSLLLAHDSQSLTTWYIWWAVWGQ